MGGKLLKVIGAMIVGSVIADLISNNTFNREQAEKEKEQNEKLVEIIKTKLGGNN